MPYFMAECVDKTTGRSFPLRLQGESEEAAAEVAHAWGFVTGPLAPSRLDRFRPNGATKFVRGEGSAPASEVDDAYVSNDLQWMLRVENQDCRPVTRHFLLQSMAEEAYRRREREPNALLTCERVCWQWLMEAPALIGGLLRSFPDPQDADRLEVRALVPKRLTILLERAGEFERAAEVCRVCASLEPLHPEDRAYLAKKCDRLERKLQKAK